MLLIKLFFQAFLFHVFEVHKIIMSIKIKAGSYFLFSGESLFLLLSWTDPCSWGFPCLAESWDLCEDSRTFGATFPLQFYDLWLTHQACSCTSAWDLQARLTACFWEYSEQFTFFRFFSPSMPFSLLFPYRRFVAEPYELLRI